jgi:hypothetical protein
VIARFAQIIFALGQSVMVVKRTGEWSDCDVPAAFARDAVPKIDELFHSTEPRPMR